MFGAALTAVDLRKGGGKVKIGAGKGKRTSLAAPSNAFQNTKTQKQAQKMSNQEFVQSIADRAEKKVGGTGPYAGTRKHKYAEKLLERYQDMSGRRRELAAEKLFKGGKELNRGDPTRGSTRLDVVDGKERVVYDYKFVQNPGKGLRPQQIQKIQQQGPENIVKIIEINPSR